MYAGIIIWSLCGGCRSTERLYFLKYCNPHLFCFFTSNTALRSLSDYNALSRTVTLNAVVLFPDDFSSCVCFLLFTNIYILTLAPPISNNLDRILKKNSLFYPLLLWAWTFCSLSCPLCSAAVCKNQSRSSLWLNGVSRIYPFNLPGDLYSPEKGSHSFSLEWLRFVE